MTTFAWKARWPARATRPDVSVADVFRAVALVALLAATLWTPGFYSRPSLLSLLTTLSFVGCVAVGATFIMIGGQVMSFALGATLGASAMVFVALVGWGLVPALLAALAFAVVVSAAQGWLIGRLQANPIIVSMAALGLITGIVTLLTEGRGVYPQGEAHLVLKGLVFGLPVPLLCFGAAVVVGQALLSTTAFGHTLVMVGSNRRAAVAAGLPVTRTLTLAYALAGGFAALAAVLMAARYGSGEMEFGNGIDYQAIGAVLVGGTAIQGGRGSVLRTLAGALVVAVVESLLLLRGFSTPAQLLAAGVIVLGVILLQAPGRKGSA